MLRTTVIANPHAGSAELGEHLERLATREHGFRWHWSSEAGEVTRLARDAAAQGVERVVAAGGDGTVHLVAQGIFETDARPVLAVLPIGTGNDLARVLGLGIDPERVLAALAAGTEVRAVDVARASIGRHERVLVNSSAAGLSGEVDRAIDEEEKARWGAWAYVRGALEVIGDMPSYRVDAWIDGAPVERGLACVGLTVTNGRSCGGGLEVAPAADLEDGKLDLLMIEHTSKLALAGVAAQLRLGGVLGNEHVRHHQGAVIELESDPPMPINVDGELLGDERRARFEVLPRALPVAIGPDYTRGLPQP